MKKILVVVLMVGVLLTMAGCGKDESIIKVGHKNYTEGRIMGQMFSIMIEEHTDYTTTITELGGTTICFEALKAGDIDLYPEYTGTGYTGVLNQNSLRDTDEVYDYCQEKYNEKFNITWLKPLGFNNTYTKGLKIFGKLYAIFIPLGFIIIAIFHYFNQH